jgi:4'-phosphopantetheinyl transferase
MTQTATLTAIRRVRQSWTQSRTITTLAPGEFHVWLAPLDPTRAGEFEQLLSPDERAKAACYRFAEHRRQFIVARGFLRSILGGYLEADPASIRFEFNEYGKPSMPGHPDQTIKFNLSHSGDLALYAFALESEIGVDIECVKSSVINDGMLSHCLTPWEIAYFHTLDGRSRESFFFDCWVRKEAFLKLRGDGFMTPPNQIEVSSTIPSSKSFTNLRFRSQLSALSIQDLPVIPGYKAAIALEGFGLEGKFFTAG